jgi:four helix bundle protein
MQTNKKNLVIEESFRFAVKIIRFVESLEKDKQYVLAKQILKAGTSIGAQVREAQNAESKADFIHKLKIAAKEADETEYWLLLCMETKEYDETKVLLDDLSHIILILSKIISTTKKSLQ